MKTLAQHMAVYQKYHSKEVTKITHYVGIPCVIFGILIFLSWIHLSIPNVFNISLAWLAVIAVTIYYFFYDMLISLANLILLAILAYLAQIITQGKISLFSVAVCLIFFIGGWIMQILGHYFEGKWPLFTKNLDQFLIAPMFLMADLFFAAGYKKKLLKKVNDLTG